MSLRVAPMIIALALGAAACVTDQDGDGVVVDLDCDDNDPELGALTSDGDCDGTLAADDCDETDRTSETRWTDPDCDGEPGVVAPPGAQEGPGSSAGWFNPGSRVISHGLFLEADLDGLRPGTRITGFALRLDEAEPAAYADGGAATYERFDVRIGEGRALGDVGDALSDHWVGAPESVRTGGLDFGDGALATAADASQAAPWGPVIAFDTPYTYAGGDLLLEVIWERSEAAPVLRIDVEDDEEGRSGGTVYNLQDPDSNEIDSRWDANWAIRFETAP